MSVDHMNCGICVLRIAVKRSIVSTVWLSANVSYYDRSIEILSIYTMQNHVPRITYFRAPDLISDLLAPSPRRSLLGSCFASVPVAVAPAGVIFSGASREWRLSADIASAKSIGEAQQQLATFPLVEYMQHGGKWGTVK